MTCFLLLNLQKKLNCSFLSEKKKKKKLVSNFLKIELSPKKREEEKLQIEKNKIKLNYSQIGEFESFFLRQMIEQGDEGSMQRRILKQQQKK